MVLGEPVVSPLEDSIVILLGLALGTYFIKLERCLVGVSLGTIGGLMIGTREVSLIGLSLGLLDKNMAKYMSYVNTLYLIVDSS